MPISKIPVVHKFGIISQSHRVELQRRLVHASQKGSEDSSTFKASVSRNHLDVTDEFVRDYNESDYERQQKLNETASQMICRIKRKVGLNSGGSGSHVDLMKSWTELALLSQCVGNIQEVSLDILATSLDHAPLSAGNLPALCYLAETTLYWLRFKATREPFLRSGEIKLLRTGYLAFIRLYYHYLCQRLAGMDEFRSRLSDYLQGIDESERVYCHYPGVHYYLRYIIHIGTLVVGDRNLLEPGELKEGDKIIPGRLKHEPSGVASQKYSDDEEPDSERSDARSASAGPSGAGTAMLHEEDNASIHEHESQIFREVSAKLEGTILKQSSMISHCGHRGEELESCVHDVCPSLWHTLDVWRCVTCNDHKQSFPESLRGLLSCGATLDTDNWLDALTTLKVLGEAARLQIDVLRCLQTLAKGVLLVQTNEERKEQSGDLDYQDVDVPSSNSGSTTLRSDVSTLNSQRASKGSVTEDILSPLSTGRSGLSPDDKPNPAGTLDSLVDELEEIDTYRSSSGSRDKLQISVSDGALQPTIKLTLKIIPSLVDSPSNPEETLSSAPTAANISSHESLDSAGHLIVGENDEPPQNGINVETSESISINTEDRQKEIEKALGLEDPANRVRNYMNQQQVLNDKQHVSHHVTESDIAWGNIEMVENSKPPPAAHKIDPQNDVEQDVGRRRSKTSPVKFKLDSAKRETGCTGWYAEVGSNSPARAGTTTRTTFRNMPVPDKPGIQGWYWELAYLYTDVLTNIVLHGATSEIQKLALVGDDPPRMKPLPGTEMPMRSVGLVDLLQFGCSSPSQIEEEDDWMWRVRYGALHGLVKILHILKEDKAREGIRTVVWTIVSRHQQSERDERVLEAMKVGQVDTYIYSVHAAGMSGSSTYSLSAKLAQALSELFLPQSFNKPLVASRAKPKQKREKVLQNIPMPKSNKTRVSLREKLLIATAPNDPIVVDYTNRKMLDLNRVVEDQWRKELQGTVTKQFKGGSQSQQ